MFGFFQENRNIQKVIDTKFSVVFYAESAYYYQYFHHLFTQLDSLGVKICYITSDKNDPILKGHYHNVHTLYSKTTLAFVFQKLKADVMVLTMTDLQNYIYKRSADVKKYVYVFHAMVSTHQQYRKGAFDHYDTIFCVGPHHEAEIREAEQLYNLLPKTLINYGYPLLNELERKVDKQKFNTEKVLIAPSWYDAGIFQTCIHDLIEQLVSLEKEILIRPHPEFIKRNKSSFSKIRSTIEKSSNLSLDINPSLWESLLAAGHLITDRSGIAFEFAFSKKCPVIFIDTPPKIQNPHVTEFKNKPVENYFRDKLGWSIGVHELSKLSLYLSESHANPALFNGQLEEVKKAMLYENSLQNGVDYILSQIS